MAAKVILFLALFAVCIIAQNPFLGKEWYINPTYVANVQSIIDANPSLESIIRPYQNVPTAYWLDKQSKVPDAEGILNDAVAKQTASGKPGLVFFIVYDLPNRDCAALASNGEITCESEACPQGLALYRTYVDSIVTILAKFPQITIVTLIEPDSLPNLATNLDIPKCQRSQQVYKTGVSYAIQRLATLSHVHQYVDVAHGGWLGWPDNMAAFATIISEVLTNAGGYNKIRGFASNTANYQGLGSTSSTEDPCRFKSEYNDAINEVIFVRMLDQAFQRAGITGKGYLIDTARNGKTAMRQSCSNWCNIKGSAFGVKPTTDTASSGISIIDAYYWLKTPGESDGTSDSTAVRYDAKCSSVDSFQPAPEAGAWFPEFFVMLANNGVTIPITNPTSGASNGGNTGSQPGTSGSAATSNNGGNTGVTSNNANTGATSNNANTGNNGNTGVTSNNANTGNSNTGVTSNNANTGNSNTGANSNSGANSGSANSGASSGTCSVGRLNCPCTSGGACDAGLACANQVCVADDKLEDSSASLLFPSVLVLIIASAMFL